MQAPPITFKITVNPTATVTTPANQNICNGAPTNTITFSGPVTWTNNADVHWLAASGSGNIPSFTATNAGTASVQQPFLLLLQQTDVMEILFPLKSQLFLQRR